MTVNYIPDGFHTVTPYIMVKDAEKLIAFLQTAFSAEKISFTPNAEGKVANAVYKVGDSMLMLAEARDGFVTSPSAFYFYIPDTDAQYKKALAAGGTSLMEPADQFYGDRNAGVQGPCGNLWWFATRFEKISDTEMEKRVAEFNQKS